MLHNAERASLQQIGRDELPGLYAFACGIAGADVAEDLVQETLLRACRSFERLRDVRAAPKWLRTILTNVWRDRLRRDGRWPSEVSLDEDSEDNFSLYRTLADEDPLPYSDTLHIDFLGAFSEEDVHLVLQRLPAHYRAPLVLRYVQGFDTGEIAEMLDLPLGTVLSQLHRGRQRFEQQMWVYAEESGLLGETEAPVPAASERGSS